MFEISSLMRHAAAPDSWIVSYFEKGSHLNSGQMRDMCHRSEREKCAFDKFQIYCSRDDKPCSQKPSQVHIEFNVS